MIRLLRLKQVEDICINCSEVRAGAACIDEMGGRFFSLYPARGDDRRALLIALALAAGGGIEFIELAGAEVGQRMALKPDPQVLHRVQVGSVRRQERPPDFSVSAVQGFAHLLAAVRLQGVPDDQQWLLQVHTQRLPELDLRFLLHAAVVQPEHEVRARQPRA